MLKMYSMDRVHRSACSTKVNLQAYETWYRGGDSEFQRNPDEGSVSLYEADLILRLGIKDLVHPLQKTKLAHGLRCQLPPTEATQTSKELQVSRGNSMTNMRWNRMFGRVAVIAVYLGSQNFQASQNNITFAVDYRPLVEIESKGFFDGGTIMSSALY